MKKLFFAVVAMAAMLTSCSKDDGITEVTPQNSMVTFTVNAPELATRANEGEGLQAKNLKWVIYDLSEAEGQNQISGETTFPENSLTTTVEVSLVEGREYEAIFFAYADNSPYTFNTTAQTMSIDASGLKANSEAYDAFFKYVEPFEIETEAYNVDVKMKRPFAQLNVATSDMQTDAGKMIDAATTGVKVEAYKTLDFKTGAVADKELITYALDQKMSGHIVAGQDSYDWLTMNYILVNERETVNVEFSFTDEKGNGSGTDVYTRNYTAVPVERNYRTNIVGTILTSTTNFNVQILPGFENPNIDWNVDGVTEVPVENGDLQAALDNVGPNEEYSEPGIYIFKLTEDMTGVTRAAGTASIIVEQKEGYDIIIDGCGLKFDGTFYINGNSRNNGTETLIFRNINFVHADGKIDFIWSDDGGDNKKRYPHNVTVENCTFTGNGNAASPVVGMRLRQVYNLNIVNCVSGEGMFSLAQISSSQKDLFIDNVTINNNKEGINLLSSLSKTIIKNSNISADVYGVRADGNCSDALTIENTAIAAEYPVVVRKMKNRMDVVFNGHNTLEAGQQYDVIFTNADSHTTLVEPTGEWSITGADNFSVYPREVAISTAEELMAFRDAVNAGNNYKGKVVTLANDIDLEGAAWTPIGDSDDAYKNNFAGTFDGMGYTVSNFTVNGECAGFFGTISGGATIKNLTIDNATLSGPHYAGGIVAWAEAGATSLTIENCHVKNSTITLEVVNSDDGDKAGGIIGWSWKNNIIGCSVENTTITAYRDCGGIVGYAKNGVVKDNKVLSGVNLVQDNRDNYKNYTTEAEFNFGDIIGRREETPAESGNIGLVTKTGGVFNGYSIADGEYYIFSAKGLADVHTKGGVINIVDDIDMAGISYSPIQYTNQKITINGNNNTISNLSVVGYEKAALIGGVVGPVSINDLTISGSKFVAKDNSTNGENSAAAFLGFVQTFSAVSITNCHVEDSEIGSAKYVGGLVAYKDGAKGFNINNCSVTSNSVTSAFFDDEIYKGHCGGIIGYYNGAGNVDNSTVTKNKFDTKGARCGIIVGSFQKGASISAITVTQSGNVGLTNNVGEINKGTWNN